MTHDELISALHVVFRRRPGRPFLIEFVSGDRLLVTHPEAVYWGEDLFLFRGRDFSSRIFTGESVCQILDLPPRVPTPSPVPPAPT
jgi:hypothetical protein